MIISDLRLVHLPLKTSAPHHSVLGGGARFVIFWLSGCYMHKTSKSAPPSFNSLDFFQSKGITPNLLHPSCPDFLLQIIALSYVLSAFTVGPFQVRCKSVDTPSMEANPERRHSEGRTKAQRRWSNCKGYEGLLYILGIYFNVSSTKLLKQPARLTS